MAKASKTAEVKKEEAVKKEVAKAAPKKKTAVTAKKTVEAKPVKKEVKVAETKVAPKKVVEKKETVKKEVTKTSVTKKAAPKKEEVKKAPVKKVAPKKETVKKETVKKAPAKKASPKKVKKINYDEKSLDECIHIMQLLGVGHSYYDYVSILMDEEDIKKIEANIISGNDLEKKIKEAKIEDYDINLVMATLEKVVDTMPIAAVQFKDIKKAINACVKVKLDNDADKNAKHYLDTFSLAEKVLMVAQRRDISSTKEAKGLLKVDVEKFFDYFFALAYDVLKTWQYEDIEYYQQFAFAILSQYEDLYDAYQNKIQMDCADLFILHGDEGRGDYEYGYVLRENQIKDYIYYRFANIYVERNLEKAKAIAESAFVYVDNRYQYFDELVAITQK